VVKDQRLYQLVRQNGKPFADRDFEIEFLDDGACTVQADVRGR
jgi:hypothetical protein